MVTTEIYLRFNPTGFFVAAVFYGFLWYAFERGPDYGLMWAMATGVLCVPAVGYRSASLPNRLLDRWGRVVAVVSDGVYWIPGANSGGGVVIHPKYSLSTASPITSAKKTSTARVRTVIESGLSTFA
jgi:hypothetical protein